VWERSGDGAFLRIHEECARRGDPDLSLLRERKWAWIIGSDLVYLKELCGMLASLWSLCCDECPSARILYSHTLHRWQDSGCGLFAMAESCSMLDELGSACLRWRDSP
jgi:hypothetical protein